MRTFVAMNLPAAEKAEIFAALTPLRDRGLPLRWVQLEAMHITLQFLGEVAENDVSAVADALRATAARHAPCRVSLRGVGAFPDLRRPGVLWLGVEATPQLTAVYTSVQAALARLGFEPERRAFHPHVTLARAQRDARRHAFDGLRELAAAVPYETVVDVESIDLMESRLSRGGARYSCVAAARLTAGRPGS